MEWQTKLLQNLLAIGIISSLIIIIYCKITNQTILDIIKGLFELNSPERDSSGRFRALYYPEVR